MVRGRIARKPNLETTGESYELALKDSFDKIRSLKKLEVNNGDCEVCQLKDICEYVDYEDDTCGMVAVAIQEFYGEVFKSPYVKDTDAFSIRTMASLYGIIVTCELFFQKYGIVEGKDKSIVGLNQLGKDYTQVLHQFNKLMSEFGMTPRGRFVITGKTQDNDQKFNVLARYLSGKKVTDAKYSNATYDGAGRGSKKPDRHSRVLQRSEPAKSKSSSRSRSDSESDVQLADDPIAAGIMEDIARGAGPQ